MKNFGEFKEERIPFKNVSEFEPSYLQEISSPSSNFIARERRIGELAGALYIDPKNINLVDVAKRVRDDFEKAKSYGIPVSVHVVLAADWDKKPMLYFLTPKIEGSVLANDGGIEDSPKEWLAGLKGAEKSRFISELDNLLSSLALYAKDNYKSSEFLWDISTMRQYMWGKKKEENGELEDENHLYMIDIGFEVSGEGSGQKHLTKVYLKSLLFSLEEYEKTLDTKLNKARGSLQKLVDDGIIKDLKSANIVID